MKMDGKISAADLSRRSFLELSLMGSAILLTPKILRAAVGDSASGITWHGALRPLAPGQIAPEGWLKEWLGLQARELGSRLPQISWPFTEAYWAGEEDPQDGGEDAWWPWEQRAYWIDGATRLALVLKDEKLLAQTRVAVDYTLNHASPRGYLGPYNFAEPKGNFHRWPQNVFFRALAALGEVDGQNDESKRIADALSKHFLHDTATYGRPTRNVTNIEAMIWAALHGGDPKLVTLAEQSWAEYLAKVADDPDHGDLSELRVAARTPINAHGCTYAETMKLPVLLYLATGKEAYLHFGLAANRRIFDHHMLVDGIPSTSEWYRTVTSLDSHESCDIADHTWSWGYLMAATGEAKWGDAIERACLNAGPAAIKKDWKALQYFSCPNQVLATLDSDHNVMAHGGRMMAFQPNPGQRTACCGGNIHRVFPNYVLRMWMATEEKGLAALLYGPSVVRARVGRDQTLVKITQKTSYPFEESILLQFELHAKTAFPLLLRVPDWCKNPRLELNGKPVEAKIDARGFLRLEREFASGDELRLSLPMQIKLSHWPQGGVAVERGPLVYSLPVEAEWKPVVEAHYTTPEFPSWEAHPKSAWNFALETGEGAPDEWIRVENKAIAEDGNPWQQPPVALHLRGRRIADWQMEENPAKPGQFFTPPLPVLEDSQLAADSEPLRLVPIGSTELRVTVFPALAGSSQNADKES